MKLSAPIFILSSMLWVGFQAAASSVEVKEEILPLTKSQWGQQAPFFYATPTIDGMHCKTGCVATAMSQLIYYHQYPLKGKPATYSYMTGTLGDLSFDFADNTFDYTLMKDVYDRTEPAENVAAREVSKLMFAAGVTVNMTYGLTESAGQFASISNSFREWFLYPDEGVKQLSRDYFTHEEWAELIYDELANKRPVIYMGGNGSSSHVFLCDGYKDGEFHMNWGWYGECNGYFSLIDLQTYVPSQGKVWSLNSTQSIVRGIHAPGSAEPDPVVTALNFDYSDSSFVLTSASISAANKSVVLGVKAIDSEGRERLIWADGETELKRSSNSVSFNLNQLTLPDGVYTFRPVIRLPGDDEATFYIVYCNLNNNRYLTVKIENNEIVSANGGTDAEVNVSISDFKPNSPFIYGEVLNRSFTVFAENTGNVNITRIKQWFYLPGTDTRVDAYENSYAVALSSGSSQTITLALPSNLPPGQYEMQLVDPNNNLLGGRIFLTQYNNADAITIGDSPFRFLALEAGTGSTVQSFANDSEGGGEAIMLKPSKSTFSAPEFFDIPQTVEINGKTYNVTEIGPQLAMNHTEISALTIPSSVKNIDSGAFNGCTSINEITVKAITPPDLVPTSFADAIKSTANVIVPAGCLGAYQAHPLWSQFNNLAEELTESKTGLSMDDFKIEQGSIAQAMLSLNSDAPYYGFQFDMALPEGLTIKSVDELEAIQNFTTSFNAVPENTYKIVGFDLNGAEIPVGSHEILTFTFEASESFEGGTINITNVKFSADNGDQTHKDVILDDLQLSVTATTDGSTGVQPLPYLDENGPYEIFNLSGVKISSVESLNDLNLLPGIYIVRRGAEYHKILIR